MSSAVATIGAVSNDAGAPPSDFAEGPSTITPSGFGGDNNAHLPGPNPAQEKWVWLLGREAKTRRFLIRTLISCIPYIVGMLTAAYCAHTNFIPVARAAVLSVGMAATMLGLYAALRTGWTHRFNDPSISQAQVLIAMTWIALMYAMTGRAHATQLPMLAMTMASAVFNLDMRGARLSCAFGVIVMTVCISLMTYLQADVFSPRVQFFNWVIIASTLPTILLMGTQLIRLRLRLKTERAQLRQALSRLNDLAIHDDLTGLINRSHMSDMLDYYLQRHDRSGEVFSIALLDLDFFKRINDTHGHSVGDEVLKAFAHAIRDTLREVDLAARWGGEEFLVLCPQSNVDQARLGLERLRAHFSEQAASAMAPTLRATFSAGIVSPRAKETLSMLLERADQALYTAKSAGRNRCVCA